jgi:hypothetical protein
MSGDGTNFRAGRVVRREVETGNDGRTDLEPSADLAIWMDEIILDGLRSGLFSPLQARALCGADGRFVTHHRE